MKSEISLENKKALSIPEKGHIHKTAVVLSSDCKKVSENNVSYDFLFKRTASRNDLLSVLNKYSKGTHIILEDGDYVIDAHDYSIRTTKEGIKVSGSFSLIPIALSNPHVKQLTALQDFDQEYSKMEMTKPETYFRVFPYQNFNGPAFRSKLFSYVSNMGENYGYCDGKNIYYRRASLIMPKIKITKAIPQAKMMFHTHPKRDEPSLSSPDDYLLYFDLSHKPRNIRHFYTVMADRMDYFHVTPKHDKKNDYVKINEDKFIERLDKKIDEISKIYDEKIPSGTKQDDLYYCERITKDVVKWLNQEYKKYFKIKYKCYYRVKKNPDKDKGEDLHLGDAFLAKALNDIKSGEYSWPEFEEDSIPHEKYAYWYSMYYGMRMDRSGMGYSRILRLQPGDVRRLHHFGSKRFEGTQYDYFDIINILLLNYDISLATAKVQDGTGASSRIAEILDYLELDDENAREDLILLTQVLESGIYSDEARTRAGNHYFILPLVEFCVLALQAIEDVNAGKATYEQKKYEVMILEAEKAGEATGNALGALMSMYDGQKSSLPNPPLNKGASQYTSLLPKAELANVELLKEVLQEFAPSKSDIDGDLVTGRSGFNLRIPTDEAVVTMLLYPSTGTAQVTVPAGHSDPDAIAISAMKKLTDHLNGLGFQIPDDDIAVIISEPVRNPKNSIIISVASPIQKVKNEVLSSLEKRIRDSTIATTYTTKPLKEYEKRPHLVEVTDDMYNRLLSNGDIIMGISYSDNIRRGYKRSDFENSKYVLVDTMIKDQDLLTKANTSIMSFYIHPTNSEGEIEDYLKEHVSPQEARNVSGLIDYLRDMAGEDAFDHIIEYDINSPAYAVEQVFKEVPKSNPKGTVPLEQTIFGDGSRYLTAQTIPITALQNLRTGTSAAPLAGPPLLNPKQPSVITISGPSGSGKSTILRKIAEMTKADIVPTVTTRERRPKEKVSDDRIFVSKDDFKQMIDNGEFVEWKQQKNGHYYGRRFSDFKDVSIVDVSLKGSREYKSKFSNSFSIFLKPNVSAKVLASHMRKRGGMSESERKGRADIIERLLESASKMDFDLVVTSRAGEYEKVAEEIIPQIPLLNPKKYQSQASVIISRSTKKDKKLMAVFNFPDGRKKTTHFGGKGYSDYTIHKDKARKKRYDTRHARREDWEDFTTAGALSKWILWNKPSLIDSFNHYKAMFSLDGAITVQTSQAGKIPASRNPPWGTEHHENPYIIIKEPWSDYRVPIDERLAPLLQHLWNNGVPTSYSDQGLIGNKRGYLVVRWPYDYAKPVIDRLVKAKVVTLDDDGIKTWKGGDRAFPENSIMMRWSGEESLKKIYKEFELSYPESRSMAIKQVKEMGGTVHRTATPTPSRNPSKTPEGRKIPKRYLKGLNKEEMIIAAKEIDKGYKYDIDDPKAYEFWKSDIKATARGYKTVPSKYKKKFIEMYGPLPEEGEFLDKMAKATKIKKSILEKVYDKGLAAWRGGHRPGVQQHQWAAGRVYSFVTLGNTVMKDGKRMSDHSLAVEAGLIKKNPSHCPIEAEARRAANDTSFKHHKWYVKHHLDYVMKIMKRMPKVMGNWDKEMVDMVWMHDYPKMMGKSQDLSVVNDLLTTHRGEDYAHKIVHQLHLMERLKKSDWNPLTEYSMVAANLSTADALAHYYGPFFQLYIDENPDMSMEEIKKSNRQKLAKDKLKLRAGPMKDGLDSIKFQYKGRKVRILGNDHIKELIEKENPPSFIAARDPDKWAKRYDRIVKMSGEELMQKAIERASEKGLTIEMTSTEVDMEKKQEARKNFPLPPKYDKLYEKFLASNSYSTILLKRGEKVVDTLEFRLIEESPAELYEYLKSRERWSTKTGMLPLVARIHRRGGKSSLQFNSYFITAALQRKERFPIAVGGVGGYEMTDRQQGKGYYGIIKTYQAGFLEENGIEAFGGGETPMRSDLYQSYGWLTAYSYKDNYPYSSTAAEYYLNLNRKDKLPNKDAGYFDLYRPVYSEAKKNPGWRHGEQMEDDPFSEYFDENVEGDENTTTA